MKVRRNSSGFTLLELMLAVAIIVVLSSMTAVNIIRRQRELTQVELDGIAREIFVAAQNHLTMAEGQGFMGVSDFGESYTETTETPEGAEQSKTYYYYVYPDLENNSNAPNMLDLMLPVASVDGLLSGSYVIRYQRDPALVLDVFYAYTSGKFQHSFTRTEVSEKEAENRAENKSESEKSEKYFFFSGNSDEQRNERQSYGDEKAVIGWYGIGAPNFVEKGATLYPPTIKLVNAEQLYVDVTNPNASEECEKAGNPDLFFEFCSTSKISFAGAGIAGVAASARNREWIESYMNKQIISYDKMNQLRHAYYFKNSYGIRLHMKKHAAIIRPKFEKVLEVFDRELSGLEIGEWTRPKGGYFISFNALPGCAKKIVQRCKDAGVTLTGAGSTYPYKRIRRIRISVSRRPIRSWTSWRRRPSFSPLPPG